MGTTIDLGLRQPCICGSNKKLKNCCYEHATRLNGWVIYRTDHSMPIFSIHTKDDGTISEDTLILGVLATYKQASEVMLKYQNVNPNIPYGIASMSVEDVERLVATLTQNPEAPGIVINYAEEIVSQEELDAISELVAKEMEARAQEDANKILELKNRRKDAESDVEPTMTDGEVRSALTEMGRRVGELNTDDLDPDYDTIGNDDSVPQEV